MLGGKASDTQPKDRALKEEMCTGSKQPGGESQKARQAAEHRTKAGTTAKAASEPPTEIAADAFTAALAAVPAEDWSRTWAADRTIMLRMTSKRVKQLVDKMRPPAFVRFSRRSFWEDVMPGAHNGHGEVPQRLADTRNGTVAQKAEAYYCAA
jgi:hypothetical protein